MTAPVALSPEAARTALRQVKDPELDMNIVDLGLVYDVETAGGEVRVKMTLTRPINRRKPSPTGRGWPNGRKSGRPDEGRAHTDD